MTFAVTHTACGHSIPSLFALTPSADWLTAAHLDALPERERESLLHTTLPQLLLCLERESFRDALRVLFDAARAHSHAHIYNITQNATHTTHNTHNTTTSPSRLSEEREEMKSPSDALRGLLHRCVGEIQLMRLSKQLAKADELLHAKKYAKALKAYNAMNIDSLTTFSPHNTANYHTSTHTNHNNNNNNGNKHKNNKSKNVRRGDLPLTSNTPTHTLRESLSPPVHAFDRLAASLKHQYFHNKGVALLKVHQVVLAIVCFKQAIAQMAYVQAFAHNHKSSSHKHNSNNNTSAESISSEDSSLSSYPPLYATHGRERERERDRERERRRAAMNGLREETEKDTRNNTLHNAHTQAHAQAHTQQRSAHETAELRAFDAQFKQCESSAEYLAICYIHTENFSEALTVLHALERLAAEERLRLWREREKEREREGERGDVRRELVSERERERETETERMLRLFQGDELSSITHSVAEKSDSSLSADDQSLSLSLCEAQCCIVDTQGLVAACSPSSREREKEKEKEKEREKAVSHLLRNSSIRSILIAFCYIKIGKLIEAEHLLNQLDENTHTMRSHTHAHAYTRESSASIATEAEIEAFGSFAHLKESKSALLAMIKSERERYLSLSVACERDREKERAKERERVVAGMMPPVSPLPLTRTHTHAHSPNTGSQYGHATHNPLRASERESSPASYTMERFAETHSPARTTHTHTSNSQTLSSLAPFSPQPQTSHTHHSTPSQVRFEPFADEFRSPKRKERSPQTTTAHKRPSLARSPLHNTHNNHNTQRVFSERVSEGEDSDDEAVRRSHTRTQSQSYNGARTRTEEQEMRAHTRELPSGSERASDNRHTRNAGMSDSYVVESVSEEDSEGETKSERETNRAVDCERVTKAATLEKERQQEMHRRWGDVLRESEKREGKKEPTNFDTQPTQPTQPTRSTPDTQRVPKSESDREAKIVGKKKENNEVKKAEKLLVETSCEEKERSLPATEMDAQQKETYTAHTTHSPHTQREQSHTATLSPTSLSPDPFFHVTSVDKPVRRSRSLFHNTAPQAVNTERSTPHNAAHTTSPSPSLSLSPAHTFSPSHLRSPLLTAQHAHTASSVTHMHTRSLSNSSPARHRSQRRSPSPLPPAVRNTASPTLSRPRFHSHSRTASDASDFSTPRALLTPSHTSPPPLPQPNITPPVTSKRSVEVACGAVHPHAKQIEEIVSHSQPTAHAASLASKHLSTHTKSEEALPSSPVFSFSLTPSPVESPIVSPSRAHTRSLTAAVITTATAATTSSSSSSEGNVLRNNKHLSVSELEQKESVDGTHPHMRTHSAAEIPLSFSTRRTQSSDACHIIKHTHIHAHTLSEFPSLQTRSFSPQRSSLVAVDREEEKERDRDRESEVSRQRRRLRHIQSSSLSQREEDEANSIELAEEVDAIVALRENRDALRHRLFADDSLSQRFDHRKESEEDVQQQSLSEEMHETLSLRDSENNSKRKAFQRSREPLPPPSPSVDSGVNPLNSVTLMLTPQSKHFYTLSRQNLTYENGIFLQNGQFTGRCFSYAELKYPGPYPAGVDARRRECYLSPQEFKSVFNMTRDAFNMLPSWKQASLRKAMGLF